MLEQVDTHISVCDLNMTFGSTIVTKISITDIEINVIYLTIMFKIT